MTDRSSSISHHGKNLHEHQVLSQVLQLPEWNVLISGQRLQYNQGRYVSHKELFRAGGPHKFPYRYMDAKTVTDLLHSCGGVVVLAHPGQYIADNVMEMMIEEHMLDGIELNHPRNDEKTREHITSLCKEHDLFMTGGTDFHGLYTKTPYPLGSFLCPKEGLHRLILAGEQANKAFYEKHPKFKK